MSVRRRFAEVKASTTALQTRGEAQNAIRRVPSKKRTKLAEPTDFETLFASNRSLIQDDPHKDLLRFPDDDIAIVEVSRRTRQLVTGVPESIFQEPSVSLMVKECLKTYINDYRSVIFKYAGFGGSFSALPHVSVPPLRELTFDVDLDDADRSEDEAQRGTASHTVVHKRGLLFVCREVKQLDSGAQINFAKAFRRRNVSLKQQPDLTHVLEWSKDDKRTEAEDSMPLDATIDVVKSNRQVKGKVCLEISMSSKLSLLLAADTEDEAAGWLSALRRAIQHPSNSLGAQSHLDATANTDCFVGLLKGSPQTAAVENSFNELIRGTKETDALLAFKRRENRHRLFYFHPDVQRQLKANANANPNANDAPVVANSVTMRKSNAGYVVDSELYERHIGKQVLLTCFDLRTKLQLSLGEPKPGLIDNSEPFFITLSLFDARDGRKLSEDVHFTPNTSEVQQMIPTDILLLRDGPSSRRPASAGGSLSTCQVELVAQSLSEREIDAQTLAGTRRFLFNVTRPHSDVFLVARLDKVLSGALSSAVDTYSRLLTGNDAQRAATKQQRTMRSACAHLGHQRMPLGWAARALFRPTVRTMTAQASATYSHLLKDGVTDPANLPATPAGLNSQLQSVSELDGGEFEINFYRCDQSKLSDDDLLKCLQELRRPDRSCKSQTLQASLRIKLESLPPDCCTTNTLTSSLLPLEPFESGKNSLVREAEEFLLDAEGNERSALPYATFKNLLYVYPRHLNFASQNHFPRSRNLCCVVELRDSDHLDAVPLRAVYARPPFSAANVFGTQARTSVTHHNVAPDFYDELKFALPTNLHAKHHLLFSFYHVSCELSKSDTPHASHSHSHAHTPHSPRGLETPVGHAWLPLFAAQRLAVGDVWLPIAAQLPHNYLEFDVTPGRTRANSVVSDRDRLDVRWIDSAKPLFRVQLRLVSTVFTRETQVHRFFQTCERITSGSPAALLDADINALKGVLAADLCTLIHFAPALLNQLFGLLLVATEHEEATVNVARILVQLVALFGDAKADKSHMLRRYLRYAFCRTLGVLYAGCQSSTMRTVHEELIRALLGALKTASADAITVDRMLQHLWFYVDAIRISAAYFLQLSGRVKMLRTERFSPIFYARLEQLVSTILPLLVQKSGDQSSIAKSANESVAELIKLCFSLADRSVAFKLLSIYLDDFPLNEDRSLQERRFELLRSVCAYEHYVPLNMPLLQSKSLKELRRQFVLSSEFVSAHFLAGTLLLQLRDSLNEPKPIRKLAITTLRNVLAKHAFDERYEPKEKQARVVSLYLPLVSIVLECKQRFRMPTVSTVKSEVSKNAPITRSVESDQSVPDSHRSSVINSDTVSVSNLSITSVNTVLVHPVTQRHSFLGKKPSSSSLNSAYPATNGDENAAKVVDTSILDRIAGVAQGQVLSNIREKHDAERSESTSLVSRLSAGSDSTLNANEDIDSIMEKTISFCAAQLEMCGAAADGDSLGQSATSPPTQLVLSRSALEHGETRELLGCFLYVLTAVSDDVLLSWFRNATENETLALLDVLRLAVHHFMYAGRKRIVNLALISGARLPSQAGIVRARATTNSVRSSNRLSRDELENSSPRSTDDDCTVGNAAENEAVLRSVLEANASAEVALIVLDVIGLYVSHFKAEIERTNSEPSALLAKLFDILLCFLQTNQAESTLQHVFPAMRLFVQSFATTLFQADSLTQKLCFELLRCCNSRLSSTRGNACFLLYWTMRLSYETLGRTGFNRILLQLTMSVSTVATDELVNSSRFGESLSLINSHAQNDSAMQPTALPNEVKELTKSIRTILMATAQIRNCFDDPEQNIDLHYALAHSYSRSCPALRITWLNLMAEQHTKYSNHVEAALCNVHAAALINELLRCKRNRQQHAALRNLSQKTSTPNAARDADVDTNEPEAANYYIDVDMSVFTRVSPNVATEEVCLSGCGPNATLNNQNGMLRNGAFAIGLLQSGLDIALDDVALSELDLVDALRKAARCFRLADRHEAVIEIQKLLVTYYESRRDYSELARIYETMQYNCTTLASLAKGASRRLLGTYFRVAFFGSVFEQDDGREYIYKEPKITSLAEFYERLQTQFSRRFGRQAIKVLTDSHRINPSELNAQIGYIQVTHVTPYFNIQAHDVTANTTKHTVTNLGITLSSEDSPTERARGLVEPVLISDYEYHTNIDSFIFEAPFVLNQLTKSHGSVEEQCKRRTVLITANRFPFVKKRIVVVSTTEMELSPIEVAIDELAKQVRQLKEILSQSPQDIKKLQLKLQGSVSVQVNAGPIAYAEAFLHPDKVWLYHLQREKVDILKFVFQHFIETCQEALERNRSMITSDQWEYHEALKASFEELVRRLNDILREPLARPVSTVSNFTDRTSGSAVTHLDLNSEQFQDIEV